jgi:hypothetical protein
MAGILSTKAINYLTSGGSYRKMLKDCVLSVFSGTAPATADAAATGLLCTYTKASGAMVIGTNDYSIPDKWAIIFTDHDENDTYIINVLIDGNTHVVSFTANTASIGGHTLVLVGAAAAKQFNEIPGIHAVSDGNTGESTLTVWVQGDIGGLAVVISDGGGTATDPTYTHSVTASRSGINTLQFGPPTAGLISKTSDVWSGEVQTTGVAGYFRFHVPGDTHAADTGFIYPRYQGAIATSGLEGDLTNTTLTDGATSTIDNATITLPIVNA